MSTNAIYAKINTGLARKSLVSSVSDNAGADVARYLLDRLTSGKIAWATAKHYASSVRHELRETGAGTSVFDRIWGEARATRPPRKPTKRPSKKAKITQADIDALKLIAATRDGHQAQAAFALFHAAILFGLRPCEWSGASWEDDRKLTLVVPNAKTASRVMEHGPFAGRLWTRGNGIVRRLVLTEEGIKSGVQSVIDAVLKAERMHPWKAHRFPLYHAFRSVVTEARKVNLIPQRLSNLTIYSGRHQFASDAKVNMNMTAGEIAAAMGHSSVRTAAALYGRKSNGGSFKPMAVPDPVSINAVVNLKLRQPADRPKTRPSVSYPSPK